MNLYLYILHTIKHSYYHKTVQLSARAKCTNLRSEAKTCPSSVLTTRPFSMSHLLATMTVGIPGRHAHTYKEWCNGCCSYEEEQTIPLKWQYLEMDGIIINCSVVILSLSLFISFHVSICHLPTHNHRLQCTILRVHAWGEISELRPIKAGWVTLTDNSAIHYLEGPYT